VRPPFQCEVRRPALAVRVMSPTCRAERAKAEPVAEAALALPRNGVRTARVSCSNVPRVDIDAGGEPQVSKRFLGWALFGACAAAVLFVVVGGHVGTVVGEPLRLWGRWWSGDKVDDARLWGWPMLAWGRTGKGLQFAAGFTVILDLAGPERLREFGTRLGRQSWRRLADRLEEPVMTGVGFFLMAYLVSIVALAVVKPPRAFSHAVIRLLLGPVGFTGVLLCFLSLGFLFLKRLKRDREEEEGAPSLGRYLPFLLVGGIPVLLWIAVTRGFLIPVVVGLAKSFGDPNHPGHLLRWIAFVLFVIGFGLDLLAS
jgi:hypothetical protein